jgi:hypothetical protein
MMAKMFYTAEETQSALGKNAEEIKQLTREGKLREFRDGARVMFKADQVENLKSELGIAGDALDIGPSDSGGPLGLADSASGTSSGSVISLADSGPKMSSDDTATDIGLSASQGTGTGIPLAGSMGGSMGGTKAGTKAGTGINVLGLDEGGADPSAQTAVSSSFGGEGVNLEAMGSGSGLLDLSNERDDTSLGAPVLGNIDSGGSGARPSVGTNVAARGSAGPMYLEAPDPLAPAVGAMALGGTVLAILGLLAVAGGVMNTQVPLLTNIVDSVGGTGNQFSERFLRLFGAGAGIAVIGFVIGMVMGKKK